MVTIFSAFPLFSFSFFFFSLIPNCPSTPHLQLTPTIHDFPVMVLVFSGGFCFGYWWWLQWGLIMVMVVAGVVLEIPHQLEI